MTESKFNRVIVSRNSGVTISYSLALILGDYKLHPCNLPFGPHFVRSILLRAKLVLRFTRRDVIMSSAVIVSHDSGIAIS